MKLLFDQNISFRIVKLIRDRYPDVAQITQLELSNPTDREIWKFARENNYTIVTFDSDFNDLLTLYGLPPKIIWLRLGNTSTQKLADFFIHRHDIIQEFISHPNYRDIGCLEFEE